jgi:hypothetical protein
MSPFPRDGASDSKTSLKECRPTDQFSQGFNDLDEQESAPLLAGPSSSKISRARRRRSSTNTTTSYQHVSRINPEVSFHSSDESNFFDFILEKVTNTRFAHFANKLAVSSEPGLTNAQLMLTNEDLKPVEPQRRQWGAWNFVGFWVADSFNIVSCFHVNLVDFKSLTQLLRIPG